MLLSSCSKEPMVIFMPGAGDGEFFAFEEIVYAGKSNDYETIIKEVFNFFPYFQVSSITFDLGNIDIVLLDTMSSPNDIVSLYDQRMLLICLQKTMLQLAEVKTLSISSLTGKDMSINWGNLYLPTPHPIDNLHIDEKLIVKELNNTILGEAYEISWVLFSNDNDQQNADFQYVTDIVYSQGKSLAYMVLDHSVQRSYYAGVVELVSFKVISKTAYLSFNQISSSSMGATLGIVTENAFYTLLRKNLEQFEDIDYFYVLIDGFNKGTGHQLHYYLMPIR